MDKTIAETARAVALSDVAPELRGPLKRLPKIPFSSAFVRWLADRLLARTPAIKLDGVRVEQRGDVGRGVRIYRPDVLNSGGALLWMHGGGFVIGRAVQDDRFCAETALKLGVVVISIEYRAAPKHPFPAALDDAFVAWTWLQGAADSLGVNPARVAVGGQSAGGGLAASLIQRVHDAGGIQPSAQWLFCPMLDDRTAARRELDAKTHFVWSNRNNAFAWKAYLGAEPGSKHLAPYAAPARRERLEGLPQAWIYAGGIELFLDEDRAYAERLRAAGVKTRFTVVPGAPHGFEAWAYGSPQARELFTDACTWLSGVLAAP